MRKTTVQAPKSVRKEVGRHPEQPSPSTHGETADPLQSIRSAVEQDPGVEQETAPEDDHDSEEQTVPGRIAAPGRDPCW